MTPIIKENNGVFLVEGSINTATTKSFETHFKTIERLTITIKNITCINANRLYTNTLNYNRDFFIVYNGCKEIYNDFLHTVAAA
ncbi:MAG: hypothetical protein ACPGUH_00115 [Winogradskyella sp.]